MNHLRHRAPHRIGWSLIRRRNRRIRLTARRILPSAGSIARVLRPLRRLVPALAIAACLTLLGAGLVFGHRWIRQAPHFALKRIRLSPTRRLSEGELLARIGIEPGTNVFAIDLPRLIRDVSREPWVASVAAHLELPSTLVVDVVEREASLLVSLGSLYLVDGQGVVFKRATPDETEGLAVVTGLPRELYVAVPEHAHAQLKEAVAISRAWHENPKRPRLGELHLAANAGVTAFTSEGAVGVRIGRFDEGLEQCLERFDLVWRELSASGERPRFIYLDNRARPDRVTVKLAKGLGA